MQRPSSQSKKNKRMFGKYKSDGWSTAQYGVGCLRFIFKRLPLVLFVWNQLMIDIYSYYGGRMSENDFGETNRIPLYALSSTTSQNPA